MHLYHYVCVLERKQVPHAHTHARMHAHTDTHTRAYVGSRSSDFSGKVNYVSDQLVICAEKMSEGRKRVRARSSTPGGSECEQAPPSKKCAIAAKTVEKWKKE